MGFNVIDIEGIGKNYAEKLKTVGIQTTDDLLLKGGSRSGREKTARETGIPESLILTWVNHADLCRVRGVGAQFAELLEAAGVDTVKEFAGRNAENLHAKLVETNETYGLSGRVPSVESLLAMIEEARQLDPAVFH